MFNLKTMLPALFKKDKSPKNWEEAFNSTYRNMSGDIWNIFRLKYLFHGKRATKWAYTELQKMKFLEHVPKRVLREWAKRCVLSNERETISCEEIRIYFPGLTKNDSKYLAASISNTCRTFWDIQQAKECDAKFYLWKSSACPTHKRMNNIICPIDEPVSKSIVKDDMITGDSYPGEGYRCLCILSPLLSKLDLPNGKLRVYMDGEIHRMGRKQFYQLDPFDD